MKYLSVLGACFATSLAGCGPPNPDDLDPEEQLASELERMGRMDPGIDRARAREPSANPSSEEKVELGRLLFWDPVLSGDGDVACATCHHPKFGYADGLALSVGVGGEGLGPERTRAPGTGFAGRNAPTVLNTGLNGWVDPDRPPNPLDAPMFWDSRARSLESQALGPIASDVEMRGDAYPEDEAADYVAAAIAAIPEYVDRFADAFEVPPDEAVTPGHLAQAIAAFERHLSVPSSAFDRWLDGDRDALSDRARRGLAAFRRIGCDDCHGGPMFSDFELRRIGAPDNPARPDDDTGDGAYRFRTPTLRNIARTAPYMHGGTFDTLEEVLAFYRRGGRGRGDGPRPRSDVGALDPDFTGLRVDRREAGDIIVFLRALTDEDVDERVPTAVPSGLRVGGHLD